MSRAQEMIESLERYVKQEMVPFVEKTLQEFQESQVRAQERLNLAWNTINVFVGVFIDKGLISPEDIVAKGRQLAMEAESNMRAAKVAASVGQLPRSSLIKTPLELVQRQLTEATRQARHEKTGDDGIPTDPREQMMFMARKYLAEGNALGACDQLLSVIDWMSEAKEE